MPDSCPGDNKYPQKKESTLAFPNYMSLECKRAPLSTILHSWTSKCDMEPPEVILMLALVLL